MRSLSCCMRRATEACVRQYVAMVSTPVATGRRGRMAYENLELERDGYIAIIRLNRPERLNALSPGLVHDLNDVFDELEAAFPDVRAIILTGNGRGFCSGADLARL